MAERDPGSPRRGSKSRPLRRLRHVVLPEGRLWCRVLGTRRKGTPLLVVHGGPGSTHDYLDPLAALADERPVVFYDQLGSGRSDRPEDTSLWQLPRFVDELARVRRALGLVKVLIYGHSWGTMVAASYAIDHPRGLVGLILSSPYLSVPRSLKDIHRLRAALPKDAIEALEQYESDPAADSVEYRRALREFFRRHLCRLDPLPQVMRLSQELSNTSIYEVMWGPLEFFPSGNLARFDLTDRLRELPRPTLFLCGRHDETPPERLAWYRSLVPGSEMFVFENSSHMAHLEEPRLHMRVLREFMRRVDMGTD